MALLSLMWALWLCFSILVDSAAISSNDILNQLKSKGACCTALQYFLPGKVVFQTDVDYLKSQKSFWSSQEQSVKPTCIVIPTSTQEVSNAVTILSIGFQASIPGCQFAVRGGGHTPHAGAANIQGGVTLDLQSMNSVAIASDQQSAVLGAGNRFGNAYKPLSEQDLAMVGGRLTSVGAAGLLTGGGVSFFSGLYGLACNNIISHEVVLGNGTVVTASSTSNPTLFRALKGGGNNFGIVTSFTVKLRPQSAFWGGQITQAFTNKDAAISFMAQFARSDTYDPSAALIFTFAWVSGLPISIFHYTTYANGSATWPPPAFAALDAQPKLVSTVRKDKIPSFSDELSSEAGLLKGKQNVFLTVTFVNDGGTAAESYMKQVVELTDAVTKELLLIVGFTLTLSFQPFPHVLYSKDAASNALGLEKYTDDLINVLYTVSWALPLDNDVVYARLQKLELDLQSLAREKGLQNEWLYLNYAAGWQKPVQAYGTESVSFLKGVSDAYDPAKIFQKAVPGGFKLS
ncbi:FAD-binding domain-containing protein [Periconia macrospinosa]|uniref:FAD-binding domain-containing protein n=1 Tax=Periconia macrospinosa TaxID=97972 RepID=A0A2V1E6Z4_9PLEO|nr:FAD-binding domain-containing protein [Periconia macrospinosa]